jgi:hypothetical protein
MFRANADDRRTRFADAVGIDEIHLR